MTKQSDGLVLTWIRELFSQFRQSTRQVVVLIFVLMVWRLAERSAVAPELAFEVVKWIGAVALAAIIGHLFPGRED